MPSNPKVDAFMQALDHPFKAELAALRAMILGVSPEIQEDIKWQCPTFEYRGTMASLVVRTKKAAHLMFHRGTLLDDPTGILEGDGPQVRKVLFDSLDSIADRQPVITGLVESWMQVQATAKRR